MKYNHDKIEKVIHVLQAPKEYLSDFLNKYKGNKEMLVKCSVKTRELKITCLK